MGSYEDTVRILDVELGQVEQGFRGLADADWATPTKLRPLDETKPPWTLFELAGHFDISIGLTVMLMAEPQAGQVGRDRVSFFIFPRYALMRLDEFVASRVVEAVVHGLDLTDALGREPMATPEGVAVTAAILDDLLARKTVAGRPPDLGNDMVWVRAASGRGPEHPDPRLPLIG
jgi:hypothetical protein